MARSALRSPETCPTGGGSAGPPGPTSICRSTSGRRADRRLPRTRVRIPRLGRVKGQVQDRVEVLSSADGVDFTSRGLLKTSLWKKDIPINYMLQDDGRATGWNFELIRQRQCRTLRQVPADAHAEHVRERTAGARPHGPPAVRHPDRATVVRRVHLRATSAAPTAPPAASSAPSDDRDRRDRPPHGHRTHRSTAAGS